MAEREEILDALQKARAKLLDEKGQAVFKGWSRQILYCLTDVDETWLMRVVDGMPQELVEQDIDEPDIKFTMTSDMLVKLMKGQVNGLVAFTTGQVKVKASMEDIKQLQKLV